MQEQNDRSRNADGEFVRSPEGGPYADTPLRPGAHSGSGDVEHAARDEQLAAMPARDRIPTSAVRYEDAGMSDEHDPHAAASRPHPAGENTHQPGDNDPGGGAASDKHGPDDNITPEHSGHQTDGPRDNNHPEDTTTATPAPDATATPPTGESQQQLDRINRRNQQLLDGDDPSPDHEAQIAGVRTGHSEPPRTGDYSHD